MKRFLAIIFSTLSVYSYGQIYTSVKYLDKYDDVVLEKSVKTIVEKTDSTFIVDTKGQKPETYYIVNYAEYNSAGDKDNIVNLVSNVYGYQESWCVIKEEDKEKYIETVNNWYNNVLRKMDDTNNSSTKEDVEKYSTDLTNELSKYWLFVVHRVIVTQYSHTYENEYFWVQDESSSRLGNNRVGHNINRIIYKK